jgi:hypothetical protein
MRPGLGIAEEKAAGFRKSVGLAASGPPAAGRRVC